MDKNKLRALAGIMPGAASKATPSATQSIFESGSREQVGQWLKENSSDYIAAMSKLNAVLSKENRTFSADRKGMLESVKNDLREAFGLPTALEPFNMQAIRRMAGLTVAEDDAGGDGGGEAAPEEEEEKPAKTDDKVEKTEEEELTEMLLAIAKKAEGKDVDALAKMFRQIYDAGHKDGKESAENEEGESDITEAAMTDEALSFNGRSCAN